MATCVFCGRSVAKSWGTMVITWRYSEPLTLYPEAKREQVVVYAGAACSSGMGCSGLRGYPSCTLSRDCSSVDAAMAFLADYTFMMWTVELADGFERAARDLARAR